MRSGERIERGRYTPIQYHQFTLSRPSRLILAVLGVLCWPIVLPLALISRVSDFVFLSCSQLLAIVPSVLGYVVRYEFYRFALKACGQNVMIGFGTIFLYRDIEIGDNVLIGMYNTIHHVDIESYVLIADGCRLLSGNRYHHFDSTDAPMALQGGALRRIVIERDCWIGANAVVMADVGAGSVVAAGAVVTEDVAPRSIVGGVPARLIRKRSEP